MKSREIETVRHLCSAKRLVQCSYCLAATPGDQALLLHDLEAGHYHIICRDCAAEYGEPIIGDAAHAKRTNDHR